jgi:serine protease
LLSSTSMTINNVSRVLSVCLGFALAAGCSSAESTSAPQPEEGTLAPQSEASERDLEFDGIEKARIMKVHGAGSSCGGSALLSYQGGASDGAAGTVGVETAPKVYVVFWGSQWSGNDPSGEVSILENFFAGVGGSSWNNSVTQYCEGTAAGTRFCSGAAQAIGNRGGVLAGTWSDAARSAPRHPTQSQLATEAIAAAAHFGNTTAGANANTQYVIATAHGNNARGFGSQYCAWHSVASSAYGYVAFTNLPYITDAGSSCGANFNGLGPNAGITIVAGHEFAESETDPFPSTGWIDSSGCENGDKCAWISSGQGAAANVTLATGTFAVQSLWSNAYSGDTGGCVLTFP